MKLKLTNRKQEIGDVYSFFFEPLESIVWQAGQYLNLSLPDVAPVYAERLFTIASAPYERRIQITTLITDSPFKTRLNLLSPGDVVEADQLGGDFVWLPDGRKKLFLAGGIGITPFRSIVFDQIKSGIPIDATLLYGGKPNQQPFLQELSEAKKNDGSFNMTIVNDRRLTPSDISIVAPDFSDRLIYIAGPQTFVEGFGEHFMSQGIPRSQIKYDWFDGYFE